MSVWLHLFIFILWRTNQHEDWHVAESECAHLCLCVTDTRGICTLCKVMYNINECVYVCGGLLAHTHTHYTHTQKDLLLLSLYYMIIDEQYYERWCLTRRIFYHPTHTQGY